MRVLVLGGNGFVGSEVVAQLNATDWATPIVASRAARPTGKFDAVSVDACDVDQLVDVLHGVDAVVNSVAGDADAIAIGAASLARAALLAGSPRIVHMSSMSVYGRTEGLVNESFDLKDNIGWYGRAKIQAEIHMESYAAKGGAVVILRPGCVIGPGSKLWVDRIGSLLQSGRLGNLGAGGDGPANLVDVTDVAQAALKSLRLPMKTNMPECFNLACPDSPRWNDYFADFAMAIGATPLKTFGQRHMQFYAFAYGVPIKILERAFTKFGWPSKSLPDAIPPSLLGLWRQQIALDSRRASHDLGLHWMPYERALQACAQGYHNRQYQTSAAVTL
jgi:nucleoside-diphosphate-sugar epimerase